MTTPDGQQPPGLSAQLSIAGVNHPFGVVVGGFTSGQTVALNETVTNTLPLCTVTSQRVTLANGATVSATLPYSATLLAGANTYTITNVVTCTSSLQLTKTVVGGTALPTAWTLTGDCTQWRAGRPERRDWHASCDCQRHVRTSPIRWPSRAET